MPTPHDAAYRWAERHKLETHPKTEKCVEAKRPAAPKQPVFANVSDDELPAFDVPTEWLADVK